MSWDYSTFGRWLRTARVMRLPVISQEQLADEETGDLKMVQDFAGHADPKTTTRYTLRANEERMRTAVARSFNYRTAA